MDNVSSSELIVLGCLTGFCYWFCGWHARAS